MKSMWNLDSAGKIIGMNLDNIPKNLYVCNKCNKNRIALGHKTLCDQCLEVNNNNSGVYLLIHLVTGDKYIGKSKTLSSRIIEHLFSGGGSVQVATISSKHYCLWLFIQLSTNREDEGWWIEELSPSLNKTSVTNNGITDLQTALDSIDALEDQAYLLDDLSDTLDRLRSLND